MRKFVNCLGEGAGWDPEFCKSRKGNYFDAHKTFIGWREEAKRIADEDEESRGEPCDEDGEDPSIIQTFMQGPQGSDICDLEASVVENFCGSNIPESLREDRLGDLPTNRNFWFAGSCSGGEGSSRIQPQWLTPQAFCREFNKHVRFDPSDKCVEAQDMPGASGPAHGVCPGNPGDDGGGNTCKLTSLQNSFVGDPDALSFGALISTATIHLASPLAKTLHNHLASVTSIEVETCSDRFLTFQLSFSLPYFAWRTSPRPCKDQRLTRTNQPLRSFRDVSPLILVPNKLPAYLYQAQISCVVAGFDEWTWTAHCLADSYFDGEDGENVQQYSKDARDGASTNPFLHGVIEAGRPFHKAREFFLRVFSVRLKQVWKEWQTVVTNIKNSISRYEEEHLTPLLPSCTTKDTRHDEAEIRKAFEWVNNAMRITKELSEILSKTVDACERFAENDAVNFQDFLNISHAQKLLHSIQRVIEDFQTLRTELRAIIERCEDFVHKLEFRIQLEAICMGNFQSALVKDNNELAKTTQRLSVIMMLFVSPVAVAAQIFSIPENLVPFVPRNFVSFLVLTCTLGIASYAFLDYQEIVRLWRKLQPVSGELAFGNVLRFWATGIYGARATARIAGMVLSLRRPRTNVPPQEVAELGMMLPLRLSLTDLQNIADDFAATDSAHGIVELSHAV
ncbi:hypothetical protein EDD37DRAFT_682678 [Exophiala viscosa]|uniref:uncharacterized protein n=1 Tax=Exophiala viscosa TaxID=2486360 RepID=UPI002198CDD5|nr:hypothetical protein EDD37DRAFT_682678 [Exophiala viscosa]